MWWNLLPLAMGAIKAGEDDKAARAQTDVNAETARWSPWTGVGVDTKVQNPNTASTMMGAGLTSAGMYQDDQRRQQYDEYLKKMGSGGNGWQGMAQGQQVMTPDGPYMQQGPSRGF